MVHQHVEPIFDNRYDAGRRLAKELAGYAGGQVVVLGIPNGGVAVALGVALTLGAELDVIVSRKIPLPLHPEACFGSVTDDGTTIIDEEIVRRAGLTEAQINYQVNRVRMDIRHRCLLYHQAQRPVSVSGKTVIIVDDGFASGYTMRAAVTSVRSRHPAAVIAAAPVGPEHVVKALGAVADGVVTCVTGRHTPFYVADYYRFWQDVGDEEVLNCLREYRLRRQGLKIEPPKKTGLV
ncbi:MAG: phosphoribosyltransferase family protein [Dehalococcoidales bacterium]|nr:phosphoribosyltransferase family protein [Dehalococcoidales bacterium]